MRAARPWAWLAIACLSTTSARATVDAFEIPAPAQEQDKKPAQNPPAATPMMQPNAPAPPHAPAPAPVANAGTGTTESPGNTQPRECALTLDAAPLLREANSRGIQPRVASGSACDMNPAANEFFGRGGTVDCRLQFSNATWLDGDAKFTSITGVGSFESRVTPTGLEVTIPPEGGVRFKRVGVQARVKKPASCPAPTPGNVLAD